VLDLGSGTGRLTAELHAALGARRTIGIELSPAMLSAAESYAADGLTFETGDISAYEPVSPVDLVFSNAALQWVPDHRDVLSRWTAMLRPAGELAVQVPANADHPSHLIAAAVAREAPFVDAFDGAPPEDPVRSVLSPQEYAEVLYGLGYVDQHVRLQVYAMVMPATESIVDWMRGTSLTRFSSVLSEELFEQFLARYRERLLDELGRRAPYLYTYKRILMWGRRPDAGDG
jgi:trans-aconitate 2-methyltransferase